jgi:hypothetical protein
MVAELYDAGCDNERDGPALPATTRIRMSETIHQDDDLHGAHPGDPSHASNPDEAAPASATHADAAPAAAARADAAPTDAAHGSHAQGTPLGPIDWAAWGAGLLGIAAGLAVAICLFISTST